MTADLHALARAIRMPYGDKGDARSAGRREIRALSKEIGKARAAADRARQRKALRTNEKAAFGDAADSTTKGQTRT